MKYCQMCGRELMDEAVICPGCGCPTGTPMQQEAKRDEVSVGLCILAFLIPLFGIIYWPVAYKNTPKRAQACGISAIMSWVLGFIFLLATM